MIVLDSDVLILDLRYLRDPRYPINKQVLQLIQAGRVQAAILVHALLEVVGNMSFNVPAPQVPTLPNLIPTQYGLAVIPDLGTHPDYAQCTVDELVRQLATQMALSDAVQAVQISKFASSAECLLTWNAKHFQGKVVIPVLTPHEWLNKQPPGIP